ncbi:uncharacterized protein [Halyomorpha halys]|uniref:uncharacterized protein n=1 Tax=Halyomorpha halys TaxID=286706 RepID=UPI0006D51F76|nr:uncharacterized protein LOC106691515 [Halyomorpha halys]
MMAKIFLPLLLIVSTVTGDTISDLCLQLVTQFNILQNLLPLEIDVSFPHTNYPGFISGHAKYRVVSELTLPPNSCVSLPSNNSNTKRLAIKVNNDRAFIISPTRVLIINQATYTLVLDVVQLKAAATKKVAVVGFSIENRSIHENYGDIALVYKNFINTSLKESITEKFQTSLNSTFRGDRVEISNKLVRQLMLNVFLATAQDF